METTTELWIFHKYNSQPYILLSIIPSHRHFSPHHKHSITIASMLTFAPLLAAFAAATVAASPLATRDAGTDLLINDLLVLDRAIASIGYAAQAYTGGQEGYEAIREAFAETNRTNRIAYYDAMKIAPRRCPKCSHVNSNNTDRPCRKHRRKQPHHSRRDKPSLA
jgi:hypothetical protein